jgi:hypothetical protein
LVDLLLSYQSKPFGPHPLRRNLPKTREQCPRPTNWVTGRLPPELVVEGAARHLGRDDLEDSDPGPWDRRPGERLLSAARSATNPSPPSLCNRWATAHRAGLTIASKASRASRTNRSRSASCDRWKDSRDASCSRVGHQQGVDRTQRVFGSRRFVNLGPLFDRSRVGAQEERGLGFMRSDDHLSAPRWSCRSRGGRRIRRRSPQRIRRPGCGPGYPRQAR